MSVSRIVAAASCCFLICLMAACTNSPRMSNGHPASYSRLKVVWQTNWPTGKPEILRGVLLLEHQAVFCADDCFAVGLETGREIWRLQDVKADSLALTPKGSVIAADRKGMLYLLDPATGRYDRQETHLDRTRLLRETNASGWPYLAARDPQGNDTLLVLWNVASGREAWRCTIPRKEGALLGMPKIVGNSVVAVVVGSGTCTCYVLDSRSGKISHKVELKPYLWSMEKFDEEHVFLSGARTGILAADDRHEPVLKVNLSSGVVQAERVCDGLASGSITVHKGIVYGFLSASRRVVARDALTGKALWESPTVPIIGDLDTGTRLLVAGTYIVVETTGKLSMYDMKTGRMLYRGQDFHGVCAVHGNTTLAAMPTENQMFLLKRAAR